MVVGIVLSEVQASYGCEAAQAAAIPPWALRVCAMGALGLVTGWVAQRQLGRMRDLERAAVARDKDVQRLQREAEAQARLVESLQARAAEKEDIRRHYQTITHWFDDLVRMLGQDLREESALTSLLRVLERELGASAGVIYLWREEERALDPAAHFGFVEAPRPVSAGDPLLVEFLAHPDWKVLRDAVKPEDVRMRDLLERTRLLANPAIPLFSTWESAGGAPKFLGLLDFAGIAPALKQESHIFMRLVATMAGQGIERTREHERKALRDGLTDLWNRRAIYEKLARCFAEAQSGRAPLAVVMSDIDKFKAFNDSYGHAAGDFVL
ncbi:MAG: GGDEF domain-containing protein, partial [Candidatus Methylomirabilis sp.]|nr:GGDEF domain-containing protein [Deltaproteobacteria bacterium]